MLKNRQLTADFIADKFLPFFKAKPHWSAKDIQDAGKEKFKVLITNWMVYKSKTSAQRKLHGSMKEHYCKLGSYLTALKQVNPTYTFKLVTVPSEYYRVDDVKQGFLAGCRKLLCLDGCFLKTFLGGMLLAAIGRDANDQMYPVAWAIVEGENNDSWDWFMTELKKCLDVTDEGKGWTLVSDQKKGLLNVVASVWSNAEHRNCARHIYANWHKKFKGDELKELYWRAARAYNEADHKIALEEMKQVKVEAYEAFINQNPKCFYRCYL
ncbi:uncharacterized protein LOC143581504 [Bidens hawaiensis]|uniref:uncharacterized protein LOC143581504 n=1 Tax=Bidens hawaiensis TaxID=980011 RepID=UPI00404A172C